MDPNGRGEQRPLKIRTSHLERIAEVYIRQSTNEQGRDHPGSIAAQQEQVNFPRRWGWPDSQIRLNEADLGLPGTSISNRRGFLEMLARVSRGEVGMVLAIAVDRLNRKTGDFINLAETAAETSTLICINGVIYD